MNNEAILIQPVLVANIRLTAARKFNLYAKNTPSMTGFTPNE